MAMARLRKCTVSPELTRTFAARINKQWCGLKEAFDRRVKEAFEHMPKVPKSHEKPEKMLKPVK